jgi:hypothetical protein
MICKIVSSPCYTNDREQFTANQKKFFPEDFDLDASWNWIPRKVFPHFDSNTYIVRLFLWIIPLASISETSESVDEHVFNEIVPLNLFTSA